jgi:membrane associated rhomboid family serine protease
VSYGQPASAAADSPRCYRHPDRPTWIRCARCERPICPECMTVASVGYQCPECVREGAASVRQSRTLLGGRVSREGAVSQGIIVTCILAFLAIDVADLAGGLSRWGMYPAAIALNDEWFRLVSSIFLHSGWLHLAFNMYFLWVLGPGLESVLGHRRFLVLFLVAGLGGSVVSYCFSPIQTLSVGASGAIFGLMTAWIIIGRRLHRDVSQILTLLVLNIVLGFVIAGIDWRAHLGGAAAGAAVAAILSLPVRREGTAVTVSIPGGPRVSALLAQTVGIAAVVVVLVVMTAVRTSQIEALVGLS